MFARLFFMVLAVLFSLTSVWAKTDVGFTKKWLGTEKKEFTIAGKKQTIQLFRRYMTRKKSFYSIGDITLNTIEKGEQEGFVNPDEFIQGMDKSYGVKSWKRSMFGKDVVYEGRSELTGKLFRIYVSQNNQTFNYSIANYRYGYRSFLEDETRAIQHSLANRDKLNFKTKAVSWYQTLKRFWELGILIQEAKAQDEEGGSDEGGADDGGDGSEDNGHITSLDDLTEEDIVEIVNGLKDLSAMGDALAGFSTLGDSLAGVDFSSLGDLFSSLDGVGDMLSGLGDIDLSAFDKLGDNKLVKFAGNHPVVASVGALVVTKAANKILNAISNGIVEGSIAGAKALFNIISGKNRRERIINLYNNFNEVKSKYDEKNMALYEHMKALDKMLDGLQSLIDKGVSLEDYLSKPQDYIDLAIAHGASDMRDAEKDAKYAQWLIDQGKPVPYDPDRMDEEYILAVFSKEKLVEVCEEELMRDPHFAKIYKEEVANQLQYTKGLRLDRVSMKSKEALLTKQKEGLTKKNALTESRVLDELLATDSCIEKVKEAYYKDSKEFYEEDYKEKLKEYETAVACLPIFQQRFESGKELVSFYEQLKKFDLKDQEDARMMCHNLQSVVDAIWQDETDLDAFRRDIISLYNESLTYTALKQKKEDKIEGDAKENKKLNAYNKLYEDNAKDFKNSFSKKRFKTIKKRCEQRGNDNCDSFVDKLREIYLAQGEFFKDKQNRDKNFVSKNGKTSEEEIQSEMKLFLERKVEKKAEMQKMIVDLKKEFNLDKDTQLDMELKNITKGLDSYWNAMGNYGKLVRNALQDKNTPDSRDYEATSAEVFSGNLLNMEDFINRVEAEQTGIMEEHKDGSNFVTYSEYKDSASDRLAKLNANKERVKALCEKKE